MGCMGPKERCAGMRSVRVSIVVPCRNEEDFIERCLETVLLQDYPDIVEVLVVDGMSDDSTRERVKSFVDRDARVRLLANPCRFVSNALNIGIAAASGEVIVRLDAHSRYPRSYVRQCVEGLTDSGADNYGGVVVNTPRGTSWMAKVIAALTNHPFGVGNSAFRHGTTKRKVDTVPFGCFRRELFRHIGLFDERLVRNEDNEFNSRIISKGGTIILDPAIRIEYMNQGTLQGFLRQAWWAGSWNSITHYLCPHAFLWRHQIPGFFVAGVAGSIAVAAVLALRGATWLGLVCLVPLGLYAAIGSIAGVGCARRWGWRVGVGIAPVGFIYHLVYGVGCLWGWLLVVSGLYRRRIPPLRLETNE